jgi:hypothetical protein
MADVDICNWALDMLGQPTINSLSPPFTDKRGMAAFFSRRYSTVRDAELRAYKWSFAKTHADVNKDGTAPLESTGFARRFRKPSDCLRILQPAGCRVDWQIHGDYILTNDDDPLPLTYIKRETNTALYDPLFTEALAIKLAVAAVEKVTNSNVKKVDLLDDYRRVIAEARRTNSIELPSEDPPEDTFVTVRR